MRQTTSRFVLILAVTVFLSFSLSSSATPRPCRQGLKGTYVTWGKTGATAGTGEFDLSSGRASALSNFTWEVTGKPLNVTVSSDEPFSGGNSMKGIYGRAEDETNLNIRIQGNEARVGEPIITDCP